MFTGFYKKVLAFWAKRTARSKAAGDWRADPLGHPALQQMSQRQLADLPFEPASFR